MTINDTQYSYQNELSWLTGLQTPSGRYICKGERLSDGKIDEKTFWIKRAPAAEPVSEIQIGKPFEFRCEIGSEDAIKVRWYKDDTEIDVTNSIDADIEFLGSGTTLSIKSVKAENEGRYECIAENRLGEVHVQKWLYVTSKWAFFKIEILTESQIRHFHHDDLIEIFNLFLIAQSVNKF